MKKLVIALCIFLCAGFTLSAAVNVKADELPVGTVSPDMKLDGIELSYETGTAEVVAADDASSGYSRELTISGDAVISVTCSAGETITLTGALPSDDNPFDIMITSDSGMEEVVGGESSESGTMIITYPVTENGTYMISSAYGNPVSIYQIAVE